MRMSLAKSHDTVSGIRSTPREPGQVSHITNLGLSLLICKPELITAPHKAGVRTTFYNVCKGLGRCLEPNKWPVFVRYHYLWAKDSGP